jgi:hypothetical protein
VTLQLSGGVDVTQLCDPKVNVKGEPKINYWADAADPGQAGNLLYAPVANNAAFFERFGRDMLVINGVDSQTNSHETGKLYNWTGSNAEGRPSLSALFAAAQSPEQPLAYSVFDGFSRTAGLIGYNRFDDLSNMGALIRPNVDPWSGGLKRAEEDVVRSQQLVQDGVQSLLLAAKPECAPTPKCAAFCRSARGQGWPAASGRVGTLPRRISSVEKTSLPAA